MTYKIVHAAPPYPRSCGFDFFILGVISIITSTLAVEPDDWSILGFLSLIGLLIAFYRVRQMLNNVSSKDVSNTFITFILSFSVFFLIGPLLQVFGNNDEIEYSRQFFPITSTKAVLVLGANLAGLGISLIVGRLIHYRSFINYTIKSFSKRNSINISKYTVQLILIGLAAKFYVFYNDLVTNESISSIFRSVQLLAPVGVFFHFKENRINFSLKSIFILSAVAIYSISGLLEFNKTETFAPLISLAAGILVRRLTLARFIIGICSLGFVLAILQPINIEGRNEVLARSKVSLENRINILQMAYQGELRVNRLANVGIWSRIDYTSPDAAAMWLYENNQGGDSYSLIPWLFVPRFLYPNKPEITTSGRNFTKKVVGYDTSSTGQGLFISGYYDLGWFGLIGASALGGIILAWYRAVILAAQASKSTLLLILGMMGHWMAFYISGDYLASYLGAWITSIYLIAFLFLMQNKINN